MAIAMEIYEKIRYYREHTDLSRRNVAKILGISYPPNNTPPIKKMTSSQMRLEVLSFGG